MVPTPIPHAPSSMYACACACSVSCVVCSFLLIRVSFLLVMLLYVPCVLSSFRLVAFPSRECVRGGSSPNSKAPSWLSVASILAQASIEAAFLVASILAQASIEAAFLLFLGFCFLFLYLVST